MASTVTKQPIKTISGRRYLIVDVSETAADGSQEYEITDFPFEIATLIKVQATKTSGAAATINPRFGLTSGWTDDTQNHIGTNGTTAAHINDETHVSFRKSESSIYGNSNANTGSDNAITTLLIFVEGEAP